MEHESMSIHEEFVNAIEMGEVEAVERLAKSNPELLNHPDWVPPPLHCAVLWDQPDVASVLLDHGADIEMLDPDNQTTPLRWAIIFAKPRLVGLLVNRGASTEATADGKTALELARDAADGGFEEFEDLPRREAYNGIVDQLISLGVN